MLDFENVIIKSFNLTAMGLADIITTAEQFIEMFPNWDNEPYCEPTIISSQTDRVDVASSDGTVTQQITTSFPVLNSAGSVYDYIDLNEGKLHQRVGVVDSGTLNWVASGVLFYAAIANLAPPSSYPERKEGFIFSNKYSADTQISIDENKMTDKTALRTVGYIYIKDTSYTDVTTFKSAMSGVMLYYELAEEIITDIDIPTELTEWLPVEVGGTVTFKNADESKQLAVPNAVRWVRKLNEVE